jgi:hypothetical protein
MGKAKTASKNNPVARATAKVFTYNGQTIKPVRYISLGRNFIAAQYESGQMAVDAQQKPVPWSKISS